MSLVIRCVAVCGRPNNLNSIKLLPSIFLFRVKGRIDRDASKSTTLAAARVAIITGCYQYYL